MIRNDTASTRVRIVFLIVGLLLASLAVPAAAEVVGTVASLDGEVDIERGERTLAAEAGLDVERGDVLRTGETGRVRVLLRDETVVNLGRRSALTLDAQVLASEDEPPQSLLGLLQGKARVLVSDYYSRPGAEFEIETPTAVSGVRGTEFVVVYDAGAQMTEVVGVSGRVAVDGLEDAGASGVVLGMREITNVPAGGTPSAPRRLDDELFRQYLDGLEFIGRGLPEGAIVDHPFLGQDLVPQADRIETVAAVAAEEGLAVPAPVADGAPPTDSEPLPVPDVGDLVGQPPASAVDTGEVGIRF